MKIALTALALFTTLTSFASQASPVVMGSSDEESKRLTAIIEDGKVQPFACHFGKYVARKVGSDSQFDHVKIEGKGMLINSGWLHFNISDHPAITWQMPKGMLTANEMRLGGFCNSHPRENSIITLVIPYLE